MARGARDDLLSIGDTTTDVFLDLREASAHCHTRRNNCFLCISYADKVPVEAVRNVFGVGNAANAAVGSARLGLRTAIWTVLGDDQAGARAVADAFHPAGVVTRCVERTAGQRTNFSVVLNFRAERTILIHHERRRYRLPRLPASRWVYLTSMGEEWEAIVPGLLRHLTKTGARLGFNPGTHQLARRGGAFSRLLRRTDLLLLNREEAETALGVAGGAPAALLAGIRARGPKTVVITDGPSGAYGLADDRLWFMPPVPARVVERTGAGDGFSAGVLAAVAYDLPFPDALLWGATNAASVVQHVGAREGLLTRSAMRRSVRAHGVRPRALSSRVRRRS